MRGIYLTDYDTKDTYSGVCKKICTQVKSFENNGINIDLIDINSIEIKPISLLWDQLSALFGYNNFDKWSRLLDVLENKLLSEYFDFIYIRKPLFDSHQIRYFMRIKQKYPNIKLLFEIPTFPYDNEVRLSQRLKLRNEKRLRSHFKEFIDGFVTYSKDKNIFGVPAINISNGIDYNLIKARQPKQHEGINVIAVALFEDWHGYDRFIDGMIKQRDIVIERNINLFLAGKGRILSQYKEKAKKYRLTDHIHFCGELHNEQLDDLYQYADIALDCMGRHRVGIFYNSSLKGKEYCAYGVPIISGIETELDTLQDFQYYKRIPADDTLVDMNDVVDYYKSIYSRMNPSEVVMTIRHLSQLKFDNIRAFKPVIDFVLKNGSNK